MSTKQIYEEALADVKKIKEVAEANAVSSIIEAVTPRIRELLDKKLFESFEDEEEVEETDLDVESDIAPPGAVEPEGELMTDVEIKEEPPADAVSPPDEEGKVTLDIDAIVADGFESDEEEPVEGDEEEEYEISYESVVACKPVIESATDSLKIAVNKLCEEVTKTSKANELSRNTNAYRKRITQLISRAEDMYEYVQRSANKSQKSLFEAQLESVYKELNKLQEQTMSRKTSKMMNEGDVTLKLTGLPDDIDLDEVGVDLITGAEEEAAGEEEVEAGEEGGGEEEETFDLGGDEEEGGEEETGEEEVEEGAVALDDDTVVEIDENMLRREILRMRKLHEKKDNSEKGAGAGKVKGYKDTGDALEESDEIVLSDEEEELGEAVECDQAEEGLEEGEYVMQVGDERTRDDIGGSETSVPSKDKDNPLDRKLAAEARMQRNARVALAALKEEATRKHDAKRMSVIKSSMARISAQLSESIERSKKISKQIKLQEGSVKNDSSTRSAESKTEASLRNKLAESNLINAKLLFTNKLLQVESITSAQKAKVIESLESAKTVSEAKQVYESLAKALTKKPLTESKARSVVGSSSRVTSPAATTKAALNEGYEADRWAKLAGIVK